MSPLDLFILVAYTITVIIVLTRAIDSLAKKTTISFDSGPLQAKLDEYGLAGQINVAFSGFGPRYELNEHPTQLSVMIANNSESALYVDWDRSSISELSGRSRRAIRLTPYSSPDLSKPQVQTVIPPGSSVQEMITAEGCLTCPDDNPEQLMPTKQLMNMGSVPSGLYQAFLEEKAVISYTVWLVIQMGDLESSRREEKLYVLPCNIVTKKVNWTDALPWKG